MPVDKEAKFKAPWEMPENPYFIIPGDVVDFYAELTATKHGVKEVSAFIYPYKAGSESAKELSTATGYKRINKNGNSRFVGSPEKVVINWGNSTVSPEVAKCNIINRPENVAVASNKLSFFKKMGSCRVAGLTPDYTTDRDDARRWIEDGDLVVARTILNGYGGDGIVLAEAEDELVEAPLYVKYVPKKSEWRVHVCNGVVVDLQRKARRKEVANELINWKIRNLEGGFIFARGEDLGQVPPDVGKVAVRAIIALGLDFGAVDVIYNERQETAYVLEVNTAPGLVGATLEGYARRIKQMAADRADVPF